MSNEDVKFVTVELTKKQVLTDQGLIHNDKTNKDYVRCLIGDGGTFLYPTVSLKMKESNPNIYYFSRPEGTEFQLRYSKVKDGIDPKDPSIPNEEKYEVRNETVTIEELVKRNKSNENFIGLDISKKLVNFFESKDGRQWTSVSVPVYEDPEAEKPAYYEVVVEKKRILESNFENKVYLSLFVNGLDGTPYTLNATKDVFNPQTNQYDSESRKMTSTEVIECFKESTRRYKENQKNNTLADQLAGKTK